MTAMVVEGSDLSMLVEYIDRKLLNPRLQEVLLMRVPDTVVVHSTSANKRPPEPRAQIERHGGWVNLSYCTIKVIPPRDLSLAEVTQLLSGVGSGRRTFERSHLLRPHRRYEVEYQLRPGTRAPRIAELAVKALRRLQQQVDEDAWRFYGHWADE